ncbi:unnamed protein product [Rangifer tarandus platyrhynchus]|uniref:Uncharacterized protein n=2 Tax=Rangifer tarandus platyrhynchus TaxID=3082113 RepID=A0ACB0ERU1_RANTA|nr:unnamed protein product [Rangifer tarandus platyrhynchus]CAI9703346.1 unnamed protein product [Rangifer tarandus platyrhynchus]
MVKAGVPVSPPPALTPLDAMEGAAAASASGLCRLERGSLGWRVLTVWLVPRGDVEDSKPTELTGPLITDMTPGSLRLCIPASAQSTTQRPEAEGGKWSGEGRKAQPRRRTWTAEGHSQGHSDQPPAGL